jgi:hypothetical protein
LVEEQLNMGAPRRRVTEPAPKALQNPATEDTSKAITATWLSVIQGRMLLVLGAPASYAERSYWKEP